MFRERTRRYAKGVAASPVEQARGLRPAPVASGAAPKVTAPAPASRDLEWEADVNNPLRRFAFYFALAAMFVRFSVIHEVLAVILNLNLYLLYLLVPPALIGVAISGGIRRVVRERTGRYWLLFLLWLFLSTLFSAWRGGSVEVLTLYIKGEYLMLFVAGGLAMTWKEYRQIMYTLFLACLTDLVVGRVFMRQTDDRFNLNMGGSTIANSNDFAVHLILLCGFLLGFALLPKAPVVLRVLCWPMLGYAAFLILGSGSRGAMIAVGVFLLFIFVRGSQIQRIVLLVAAPLLLMGVISLIPRTTVMRLATLVTNSADASVMDDAEGSSEARRELLEKSLLYTVQHPVFGVGLGRFSDFEGGESQREGKRGMWHETHNSFTQISSENGIPGLALFLAALVSAFRMALTTYRKSSKSAENKDIQVAAFSMMLGMIGFLTAAFFANFGYRFYEPALCGLCIVLYHAAEHEMALRQTRAQVPATPRWAPPQPSANRLPQTPSFSAKLR